MIIDCAARCASCRALRRTASGDAARGCGENIPSLLRRFAAGSPLSNCAYSSSNESRIFCARLSPGLSLWACANKIYCRTLAIYIEILCLDRPPCCRTAAGTSSARSAPTASMSFFIPCCPNLTSPYRTISALSICPIS